MIKMYVILPQAADLTDSMFTAIKIPTGFSVEIDKLISKLILKFKRLKTAQQF